MIPKPNNRHRLPGRNAVTFISAFRAVDGVVMGADSQETYGDYKLVVDKLAPQRIGKYEIAVGGAGIGDLVDSLCEHVREWVGEWDTVSEQELIHLLQKKCENSTRWKYQHIPLKVTRESRPFFV
jgi:hypothetical protein